MKVCRGKKASANQPVVWRLPDLLLPAQARSGFLFTCNKQKHSKGGGEEDEEKGGDKKQKSTQTHTHTHTKPQMYTHTHTHNHTHSLTHTFCGSGSMSGWQREMNARKKRRRGGSRSWNARWLHQSTRLITTRWQLISRTRPAQCLLLCKHK